MIAGRLQWKQGGAGTETARLLAVLDFPNGSLVLTEAGSKRRASIHLVEGEETLDDLTPGGIDVLQCRLRSVS